MMAENAKDVEAKMLGCGWANAIRDDFRMRGGK